MSNDKKLSKIFFGKVKQMQGTYGAFFKGMIDNPKPNKSDGAGGEIVDPYYKGSLIWIDGKTGKKYLVKGFSFNGVSDKSRQNGFVFSLSIDYGDNYQTEELP